MLGSGNSRLDEGGLDSNVHKYYMVGVTESTHKPYTCGMRRYLKVCSVAIIAPIPAIEISLCHFATTLATHDLRQWTI